MKSQIISCFLALGCSLSAGAITFSYTAGAIIPDGDLNGYQNSQTVSALSGGITDLNVTLNISPGFNGDFYAFLTHNGTTAILLNRVGRGGTQAVGYPDFGLGPDASGNVFTLDDQAPQDVHFYLSLAYSLNGSGQLTDQWQPETGGRWTHCRQGGFRRDGASRHAWGLQRRRRKRSVDPLRGGCVAGRQGHPGWLGTPNHNGSGAGGSRADGLRVGCPALWPTSSEVVARINRD